MPDCQAVIGVAGLGLIGGSLAKAFKAAGYRVLGFDIDPETARAAKNSGAADQTSSSPKVLEDADCVFVALYPQGVVDFVITNWPSFKKGAVIIDCCGIKSYVCSALFPFSTEKGFPFIGGHPMAGIEQSGFCASDARIFRGASFLMAPAPGVAGDVLEKAEEWVKAAGFGRVVFTTPEKHDAEIAFTSQLPHVIACAYVQSPRCLEHDGFSAGSFRDVSRVAHINPAMWAQLFIDNKEFLCGEINTFIAHLSELRDAVSSADDKLLREILTRARERKDLSSQKIASDESNR